MFDDYQICPYTGLRSFTEEESLYFKGREEHIEQATEQLQRNKFLMLTGASGDGKSSLVYAGIIPNARAGFLKSKYTQWCVADFRPERTPFKNLCKTVARQLGIANPGTVESELQHGFSALSDLYRNSKRHVDVDSVGWKQADDAGKAALKRDAANLIILVDQFEEFFTNPENYHQGVPSRDSNLVLNILLETARIALEEDLPVYVVFTMRSDYIGQCAAFRSLPEYIGFSQFFVPRLNRAQLQQVIEEPASLSGNRISRRLTERLIHDIAEGVDQLPILQHALNQIWHEAAQGKEEMDLIHYAMVGGMPASELPDEHVSRFNEWFKQVPETIRQFYQQPNLQNVLDTHANKLYESAGTYYRRKTGKQVSDEVAKRIIKTAFTCLTKIDQSRAVRNRMTLVEINSIFGREGVTTGDVGAVLDIFREPGNTFIRPFITEDQESKALRDFDVLDITHESLIRNWEYLEAWAKEEFDNYLISLDFEKQLNRWVESNKSGGFLLSIGPLTYFETWYNKVSPNAWWIARYLPEDINQKEKLYKAEVVLNNANGFLRKSASKHLITRTIMRYGPKRIAAVLAIIGFLTLSSFALRSYWQQQNAFILKNIKQQTLELANSTKVDFFTNSTLQIEQLKLGNTSINEIISQVRDSLTQINVARRLAGVLVLQGYKEPQEEIRESLTITGKLLKEFPFQTVSVQRVSSFLREINHFRATIELANAYNPTEQIAKLRQQNALLSAKVVNHLLRVQPLVFNEITGLNMALENAINHRALSEDDLQALLLALSPFENANRSAWVLSSYKEDKIAINGTFSYGFRFNGLFQELAYIYAALGNSDKALQCVDSLLKYNQSYYQNDYLHMIDNASNIAGVFYTYGHHQPFDNFVKGYCDRKHIDQSEFYDRLIGRSNLSVPAAFSLNENGDIMNLNLQFSSEAQIEYFFTKYREALERTVGDLDERNFLLALSYKNEAIFIYEALKFAGKSVATEHIYPLFDKAITYRDKVGKNFLTRPMEEDVSETDLSGSINTLFLYPDYFTTFMPFEGRAVYYPFKSEAFIRYTLDKNLFDKLYSDRDLLLVSRWIYNYFINHAFQQFTLRKPINPETLSALENKLSERKAPLHSDFNLLYLMLGNHAFILGNGEAATKYYSQLDLTKLISLLRNTGPFGGAYNGQSFNNIATAITGLVEFDHFDEAYKIIRVFKNPINRSSLYSFAARELLEKKNSGTKVQQLMDSAKIELSRIENLSTGQPNRQIIAHALVLQNPESNIQEAYRTIKNIGNKFDPTLRMARAFAFHGNLFGAQEQIINNISDADQSRFLWNILYGYSLGVAATKKNEWQQYDRNQWLGNRFINYVNEDN